MNEIDLRGLKCPLPALKTRKRLLGLAPGERLVVLADDPLAGLDIPHLCASEGHRLLSSERTGAAFRFAIERGDQPKE